MRKESIVIRKKFDFEIFIYLHVLRSLEFTCTIFAVMYTCMCACMCLCTWLNMIASKWYILLSWKCVYILWVTAGRTLLILGNVGCIAGVQKKEFLYIKTYWVKFFKVVWYTNGTCDWVKFGMYIKSHRPTYYILERLITAHL